MKKPGVIALVRNYPSAKDLPEALKVFEEYCALMKTQTQVPAPKVEVICAIEGKFFWIEHWESRAAAQVFYDSYMGVSDLPARMMVSSSKGLPERQHYQELTGKMK